LQQIIKDPTDMYVFRVTQRNEPSIILAAVDENQYELWHAAFKRAKLMQQQLSAGSNGGGGGVDIYLSLPGASCSTVPGDEEDTTGDYVRPEAVVGVFLLLLVVLCICVYPFDSII